MFKWLADKLSSKKHNNTLANEKLLATARHEPWVEVISVELDPADPGNGAFTLDWNDIFVARLVKAGYQGKNDKDIVDNWFKDVCNNVAHEVFENEMADPEKREAASRKDIGGGKASYS